MADAPHQPPHKADDKPTTPVMDVVPPKQPELPKTPPKDDPAVALEAEDQVHQKPPKLAPAMKPPKQQGSGVGLAVFATIVIVLGLAALFVYAYLRTNNISIF